MSETLVLSQAHGHSFPSLQSSASKDCLLLPESLELPFLPDHHRALSS